MTQSELAEKMVQIKVMYLVMKETLQFHQFQLSIVWFKQWDYSLN